MRQPISIKQLWQRRPGAIFFLLTSFGVWGAVSLRWITEFVEHNHPLTGTISAILVIGITTVYSHVSSVLSKLHLATRTQAALYALKEGYVKLDDLEA